MSKPFTPVTCKLCGHVDKSTKTHTGTSVMMRCSDCCTEAEPYATLCRRCCPTNHGTLHPAINIISKYDVEQDRHRLRIDAILYSDVVKEPAE